MKKTIMMVLLVSSLLSFTNVKAQSFNKPTNYKLQINPTLLGAIAGGGFISSGSINYSRKEMGCRQCKQLINLLWTTRTLGKAKIMGVTK
jgi:hypothetical protein